MLRRLLLVTAQVLRFFFLDHGGDGCSWFFFVCCYGMIVHVEQCMRVSRYSSVSQSWVAVNTLNLCTFVWCADTVFCEMDLGPFVDIDKFCSICGQSVPF